MASHQRLMIKFSAQSFLLVWRRLLSGWWRRGGVARRRGGVEAHTKTQSLNSIQTPKQGMDGL